MSGPAGFTSYPMLQEGVLLGGQFMAGAGLRPLADWSRSAGAGLLTTVGKTDILQRRWITGRAPVNLHPITGQVEFTVYTEDDYWRVSEAADLGLAVELWWDYWMTDIWYIPAKATGQILWETSRKLPYGTTAPIAINHSTRPPRALLDDVEQTIITTGTPTAGQVKVPTTSGFASIETPAAISGTYLKLRYPPILLVVITELSKAYREHNSLVFTAAITEQRAGVFTPA